MAEVVTAPGLEARPGQVGELIGAVAAEESVSVASEWQLMWWRFRKHHLALEAGVVLALFYLVVLGADFLAYADPDASEAQRGLIGPQPMQWLDDGRSHPYGNPLVGGRDPLPFR